MNRECDINMDDIIELKLEDNELYQLITYTNLEEPEAVSDSKEIPGGYSIGIDEIRPICYVTYFDKENIGLLNIVYNLINYLISYFESNEELSFLYEGNFSIKYLQDYTKKNAISKAVKDLEFDDIDDIFPALCKFQEDLMNQWRKILEKFDCFDLVVDYLMNDYEDNEEYDIEPEEDISNMSEEDQKTYCIESCLNIPLIRNILNDHCRFYCEESLSGKLQLDKHLSLLTNCSINKIQN